MSATVLYMSMSLDGFIAGPNDVRGNGLGDGGHCLHEWLWADSKASSPSGVSAQVFDEIMATGAVVVGRRTFELACGWAGDHHDGVPIFVLSYNRPPAEASDWPNVTYVDDVESAMSKARNVAGGRDVLVHGALTAQLALAAGVLDEIQIHLIPVLLGDGRRLFDPIRPGHTKLELTRVIDAPAATHLRYRVRRQPV